MARCPNCNETEFPESELCGYCGLECCKYCLELHEVDCDQNPDNFDDEENNE